MHDSPAISSHTNRLTIPPPPLCGITIAPPCVLYPQAQYYGASHSQYRFFQRLLQAFVRVGLVDDNSASRAYMPGAGYSVKETVSNHVVVAKAIMESEPSRVTSAGARACFLLARGAE